MKLSTTSFAILTGIFLISINQVTQAETKYKTTYIAKTDIQSLDWNGGKASVGSLKGIMETHGSNNSNMPNGQGIQNCVLRSVRINDATDVQAYCTYTDKDGDSIFGIAERKQGDIKAGTGGKGKTTYLGGTGKYKGIMGGCEYTTKYLPENWTFVESECARD